MSAGLDEIRPQGRGLAQLATLNTADEDLDVDSAPWQRAEQTQTNTTSPVTLALKLLLHHALSAHTGAPLITESPSNQPGDDFRSRPDVNVSSD